MWHVDLQRYNTQGRCAYVILSVRMPLRPAAHVKTEREIRDGLHYLLGVSSRGAYTLRERERERERESADKRPHNQQLAARCAMLRDAFSTETKSGTRRFLAPDTCPRLTIHQRRSVTSRSSNSARSEFSDEIILVIARLSSTSCELDSVRSRERSADRGSTPRVASLPLSKPRLAISPIEKLSGGRTFTNLGNKDSRARDSPRSARREQWPAAWNNASRRTGRRAGRLSFSVTVASTHSTRMRLETM